jgi:thymidylate synthase (FAD)
MSMRAELVEHFGTDLSAVNAARVSMDKESTWEWELFPEFPGSEDMEEKAVLSERDTKLVDYLAKHKHTSCFEHQGATLRLKVPIFIARQIQRHRTFSYNEISRRYVDSPPEFFWPDTWRKRGENVKQGSSDESLTEEQHRDVVRWTEGSLNRAVDTYQDMLDCDVAPELARMILPQNMYTEFYMTGNLRNWVHFLKLRLDGHAQKEVQDIAQQVYQILQPLWPVSVEALMKYD